MAALVETNNRSRGSLGRKTNPFLVEQNAGLGPKDHSTQRPNIPMSDAVALAERPFRLRPVYVNWRGELFRVTGAGVDLSIKPVRRRVEPHSSVARTATEEWRRR